MKKRIATCGLCGVGERVPFGYSMKREFDGRTYSGEVPATRCNKCDEVLISGPGLGLFERALTAELARSGTIGPQAFRWLRRYAGLKGMDLAALLDVTPMQVSRWENGKKPLERRAIALVSALALEHLEGRTFTRGILESLAAGKKGPRRVKIDVGEVRCGAGARKPARRSSLDVRPAAGE
jgi:DNA-binding transcriptional regulator YiaG